MYFSDNPLDEWSAQATEQVSGELAVSLAPHPPDLPRGEGDMHSPSLVGIIGAAANEGYGIGQSATIGRQASCDIPIQAPDVSRQHARITRTDSGQYVLEDLNSRNGTLVNGERARMRVLRHGDTVQFGFQTGFVFCAQDHLPGQSGDSGKPSPTRKLAAGIAHHYNNLSAVLQANLNYLAELPNRTTVGSTDVQECMADLRSAIERTTTITQQLVGFAGLGKYNDHAVNISQLALDLVRRMRRSANSATIKASIESDLRVFGDEAQLQQVVANLCANAQDAAGPTGWIWLKVRLVHPDPDAGQRLTSHQVCISVSDSGKGIDERTRPHVFEPFFSTKGLTRGTGLGLPAVHGIVENHGGSIRMESRPGAGTTFNVLLPAVTGSPPAMGEADEEVTQQSMVLLAAGASSTSKVEELLHQSGLAVVRAASSPEAISCFLNQKRHFCLALIDLGIPTLGGTETARLLGRLDPQLPIIFIGQANADAPLTLVEPSHGRFLTTPLTRPSLQAAIGRLFQRSRG